MYKLTIEELLDWERSNWVLYARRTIKRQPKYISLSFYVNSVHGYKVMLGGETLYYGKETGKAIRLFNEQI